MCIRDRAYSVDYCYDGEKALELLGVERYDLVILDLNLPGTVSYTHLDVYKRQGLSAPAVRVRSLRKLRAEGARAVGRL